MVEEPKKKRRQNVACDSCKLRRIKCDLVQLLSPFTSTSTSTDEDTPLSVLVQQNPGLSCTNCEKKGLKCTTEGIVNPSRPNKGGKRIDEARRVFGQGGQKEEQDGELAYLAGGNEGSVADGFGLGGNMDMSWNDFDFGFDPVSTTDPSIDNILQDLLNVPSDPNGPNNHITSPDLANYIQAQSQSQGQGQAQDIPAPDFQFDSFLNSLPPPQPAPTWDSSFSLPQPQLPPAISPLPPTDPSNVPSNVTNTPADFQTSFVVWDDLHANRQQVVQDYANPYSGGNAVTAEEWAANLPRALPLDTFASLPSGITPNPPTVQMQSGVHLATPSTQSHRLGLHTGPHDFSHYFNSTGPLTPRSDTRSTQSFHGESQSQSQSQGRKRPRTSDAQSSDGGSGKMVHISDANDPWRVWSSTGAQERGQVVKWGRKEAVQEQMADRTLGQALSQHLVHTFFQAVYLSYPTLLAGSFYTAWTAAGQRSDRMTAAQEVLCATIEGWGARYSDSPVVLGLSPRKAQAAPKVIQANGTFMPGTQARAHWGRARQDVCIALQARARRLVDESGILRSPSITGLQALTLYVQMLHSTDDQTAGSQHWMEARMMHSTIIEQMEILGLTWNASGDIVVHEEDEETSLPQLRLKQRRLFWTQMISDGFFSAAAGQLPRLPQEEVDAAGTWLKTVQAHLPHSTFKAIAFFLSCYHRYGLAAREIAIKISHPGRRKGTVDLAAFARTVRKIWKDLEETAREVDVESVRNLTAVGRSDPVELSPLHYLVNLRLSEPLLLLVLHQNIHELLEFRKTLRSAYINTAAEESMTSSFVSASVAGSGSGSGSGSASSPASSSTTSQSNPGTKGSGNSVEDAGVALLDGLWLESVDKLLRDCRAQVPMIQAIIPTGMIQTASIIIRDLNAMIQFLAEVPTNEQGYPSNTPGGYGWTWDTKQKEVQVYTDSLYQAGWAWSDVAAVLDKVHVTMERMTPSPEVLDKWRTTHTHPGGYAAGAGADPSAEMLQRRAEEDADNEKAIEAAMSFWPPIRFLLPRVESQEAQIQVDIARYLLDDELLRSHAQTQTTALTHAHPYHPQTGTQNSNSTNANVGASHPNAFPHDQGNPFNPFPSASASVSGLAPPAQSNGTISPNAISNSSPFSNPSNMSNTSTNINSSWSLDCSQEMRVGWSPSSASASAPVSASQAQTGYTNTGITGGEIDLLSAAISAASAPPPVHEPRVGGSTGTSTSIVGIAPSNESLGPEKGREPVHIWENQGYLSQPRPHSQEGKEAGTSASQEIDMGMPLTGAQGRREVGGSYEELERMIRGLDG